METARPDQGTGWTADAPPVVNGAPTGDTASIAERERQVAEREAAVAQREADLAQREAQPRPHVVTSRPRATTHRTTAPVSRVHHTTSSSSRTTTTADRSSVPAPAPVPAAPAPRERVATHVTVPAGTSVAAEVTSGVSSATAQIGDSVTARVTRDVYSGGRLAIPSGSTVHGTVTDAHGLGRIGGQARLAVKFDSVELPSGGSAPVYATWSQVGNSETGRDAATIAGSTVGGAILGRVLSHGHRRTERTIGGAAAGAAVGSVIASRTRGQEVELLAGTPIDLSLSDSVHVTVYE